MASTPMMFALVPPVAAAMLAVAEGMPGDAQVVVAVSAHIDVCLMVLGHRSEP